MLAKLLIIAFLAVHAAVHAAFLAAPPATLAGGAAWPFALGRSWLLGPIGLDPALIQALGVGLVVALFAAYGAAVMGVLELLRSHVVTVGIAAGSAASLTLLVIFFNVWFVLGVGIDVVLLWLTLGDWSPDALGS